MDGERYRCGLGVGPSVSRGMDGCLLCLRVVIGIVFVSLGFEHAGVPGIVGLKLSGVNGHLGLSAGVSLLAEFASPGLLAWWVGCSV